MSKWEKIVLEHFSDKITAGFIMFGAFMLDHSSQVRFVSSETPDLFRYSLETELNIPYVDVRFISRLISAEIMQFGSKSPISG